MSKMIDVRVTGCDDCPFSGVEVNWDTNVCGLAYHKDETELDLPVTSGVHSDCPLKGVDVCMVGLEEKQNVE